MRALARRRNMSQATALGARMCQGTFFFKIYWNYGANHDRNCEGNCDEECGGGWGAITDIVDAPRHATQVRISFKNLLTNTIQLRKTKWEFIMNIYDFAVKKTEWWGTLSGSFSWKDNSGGQHIYRMWIYATGYRWRLTASDLQRIGLTPLIVVYLIVQNQNGEYYGSAIWCVKAW